MNSLDSNELKTFRFKFSAEFLNYLKDFSRIHRFDDSESFKENWEIWCKENKIIINNESERLKMNGYKGDVLVKMFKSARYYFKNKSNIKKEPAKRRNYIGLDADFRQLIDKHVEEICVRRNMKPSVGFIDFMDNSDYKNEIDIENIRLKSFKLKSEEILSKLKKTYKNRYFIYQKNKL